VPDLDVARLLRPGLLGDVSILLAGGEDGGSLGADELAGLGAQIREVALRYSDDPRELEASVQAAVARALVKTAPPAVLLVDCASLFTGSGGSLERCLSTTWSVTRAVANAVLIPGQRGRIVLVGPRRAEACVAALENLARTLSIEWARYGITVVALAPGDAVSRGELSAVVAYLACEAGAYFSGCLLDLRGAAPRPQRGLAGLW
jgi:NAD(P)-dependent dehydrogenase (short-subunit alcohol dehydrogenase family)